MAYPLHDAAKTGNVKAVNELLAQQADVNQKDQLNRTPLHMAAWAGHTVRKGPHEWEQLQFAHCLPAHGN